MLEKSHLKLVAPQGEKRAVAPGRGVNADYRDREHLTETEIEKLVEAAKGNRHGHRDATMILVAYRHGLRASELCDLKWEAIDFRAATLHVNRRKGGTATTHQISATELRALRKLQKDQDPKSAFVFINERGTPFDRNGFNWLVKRAGKKAGLPFQAHAHMLRHAAGYTLANAGKDTRSIQAYLGHKDIRHTVRYTELAPNRFRNFFPD
jgi:type 1 fimbriae regulatory protein FimB/type 1 fimbriae regulatory protein FimE